MAQRTRMKKTTQGKRSGNKFRWTSQLENDLLNCLRNGMSVGDVINSHSVSRSTVYKRIRSDDDWKQRWEDAIEIGNDAVRNEIYRRGMKGVLEPVYHEGRVVGRKRKYSDNLLMFYAKSRMPEFKDNVHEHNHGFNVEGMAQRLADKIASIAGASTTSTNDGESD